jgi:hypothetical protein
MSKEQVNLLAKLKNWTARLRKRNKLSRADPPNYQLRLSYLSGVYARARRLSRAADAPKCARALGGDKSMTSHIDLIDLLIDATSKDDRRLRSKHGGALKEAA